MNRRWIVFLLLIIVLSACKSRQPGPLLSPVPTQSPLPTPTPVPLEVWPNPQASLDNFPPTQPFVVHFNQPVDLYTANEIEVFYPGGMEVKSRWNETRTQLAIEPVGSFNPGSTFQIKFGQVKSASGASFAAQPPEWTVHVMDYARVTDKPPYIEMAANRQPSFALTFNRPMNTASVARALSVQPVVPLDVRWQGQKLTVQPREPLAPGARYVFTMTSEARDIYGVALDHPQRWEYAPSDLIAATEWLRRQGNASTLLVLHFNYPMDTASVLDALAIEPPIQGKLTWSADRTVMTMTPEISLPGAMTCTLRFNGRLRDANGAPFPVPEPLSFTTPPPILSTSPGNSASVHPATTIEVKFDRLMDRAKSQAAFQITPPVRGSFDWRETTLIFQPEDGYLSAFTKYVVTIGTGAADARGEPILRQPYTWSFNTQKLQDIANFGWRPNAQVVDADGRRAIQFQVVQSGQTALTFELYRLSLNQFLDRYSSGFRGVAGSEDRPISTEGTTLATSWQITARQDKSYGAPRETIIPSNVPPGLYILNLKAGYLNDQLIVILTRHTLALKQSDDQIVAWVTNVNGGPMADMEVVVLARDGKIISQGRTDEGGIFRTQVNRDPQPLIVIARDAQDITAAGLSNEWRSSVNQWGGWWMPTPPKLNYAAYMYTDRPIYRPAQTVFFKAIVRNDDDALISLPSKGKPVTLRIRDARNNVVQTFQLATNDLGTVNGQFQLAEGAMLGEYAVELVVDGESYRQAFKVQDYRKPDYEVSVQTDSPRYLVGDLLTVSVDSRYLFGEPVPNAELTIKWYELGSIYGDPSGSEFAWYPRGDLTKSRTDENGHHVFSFNAPKLGVKSNMWWGSSLAQTRFGIEATVDDGTHQTVSNFAIVTVFDAAEKLSLDAGGYFRTPGQPFTVRAVARTIADEPVSGRALKLELRRFHSGRQTYSDVVQSLDLTTDANGLASTPLTVQEPGYYQLYLSGTDRLKRSIFCTGWLYVFSDGARWTRYNSGDLAITADRASYAPGDTARLLVESSFSGPALLTFERGTIRREQLVNLTAPLTRVDVKLQPSDAPNVFVTVNAWQEQNTALAAESYSSLADSRLRTASVELRVPVTDKMLNVTITPEYGGSSRSFAPREMVSFTVRVTNQRGQGVPAEVSLALVDEAIFSLSKELSGPILDAFYRPRANQVRTYDAMSPLRWLGGGMGGGGGGGMGAEAPRSDLPDTAAWLPVLRTDGNGEVVVKPWLPDNLTSWRLTAKVVTANTEVGEAFINITTHQPIVVRPILPRALTAGDRAALTAVVHNYSDRTREITVSIQAPGLQFSDSITQVVTLARGEIRSVGWSAFAPEAGEISVTVRASAGDLGDAVRLPLPVRPLAVPDVTSQIGEFTGEFNTTFTWPEGALSASTIKIQLNRTIAGSLLDGLAYLTGFPYGCVEQTMSKALPNAVVGRAFYQLGVSNPTLQADLPAKINAGLQKLYGYQHNDGGWGWWYDDSTHDYQTAWVVFGLSMTRDAGYEVDPQVIQRGADWMIKNLSGMDVRTRAYALYSLSIAGHGNLTETLKLSTEPDKLDTFSQAALALALDRLEAKTQARQLLDVLIKTAVVKDGEVYWPNPDHDGYYYQKTMASTTRSTALALSAFARIAPQHELEPGIVRWLMNRRKPQGWGTTNETSFAVIALTDHLLATQELAATDTTYRVELNGHFITGGMLGRGEPAVSLEIPARQLTSGENRLRITQSGGGQLYYVIHQRVYVSQAEVASAGKVQVAREYLDPKTGRPVESVTPGQLVQVRLKVTLPDAGYYIIVEDNLPGGLEALNEKLNTTSHEAVAYEEPRYYWREYGYNNKEARGDRVSFFITEMGKGERVFTYLARATFAGEFVAMPVEVWAMYDLATWGRSASNLFVVGK